MSLLLLLDGAGEAEVPVGDIDVLTRRVVLVSFLDEVITNTNYYDINNYDLSVFEGDGPVEVVSVLPVNGTSSLDLLLITQPMTLGTTYQLAINELNDRNGATISVAGQFIYRDTKADSALRSIPKHFDKRPSSIISSLLLAIGKQDDLIGGSRRDRLVVENL